ncbi:hypothetical protein FXO37_19596 [Capsicum annuum]|nr:hypothetical protein FXO37_19596 [Capsicum annuum]
MPRMQNSPGTRKQQNVDKGKAPVNEWKNQKTRGRENQRMIFKPRSLNKNTGGQQDNSAPSTSNKFITLQQDIDATTICPGNNKGGTKPIPQQLEESHSTKKYDYDIADKSDRSLLPDLHKKNQLGRSEDIEIPGEGVMFPTVVP